MIILSACTSDLKPDGSLITHELTHEPGSKLDGVWKAKETGQYRQVKRGYIYFAPLDTSMIEKAHPEEAVQLRNQMSKHIVKYLGNTLDECNKVMKNQWHLTDNPHKATIRVDIQVVKLRPTRSGANFANLAVSLFSPIPGTSAILSEFNKGAISIEGRVSDAKTKESLYEFKDSNRDRTLLFSLNDYKRFGHSEKYMQKWAEGMAEGLHKHIEIQREKQLLSAQGERKTATLPRTEKTISDETIRVQRINRQADGVAKLAERLRGGGDPSWEHPALFQAMIRPQSHPLQAFRPCGASRQKDARPLRPDVRCPDSEK